MPSAPRRNARATRAVRSCLAAAAGFGAARLLAVPLRIPAGALVQPSDLGVAFGLAAGLLQRMLTDGPDSPIADRDARRRALDVPPADGSAELLVFRKGPLGFAVEVDVTVDGRVVARLKSPRFAIVPIEPGGHEVGASVQGDAGGEVLSIAVAPGGTAAVRIRSGLAGLSVARVADDAALRRYLARIGMVLPPTGPDGGRAPIGGG